MFGTKSWPKVAAAMGTRTAQQCRERYNNVSRPGLAQKPWTDEEMTILSSLCEEHEKAYGRVMWSEVS